MTSPLLLILILVISLAVIALCADYLVSGATCIARKAGVSEFVIGLTIVGFGTSCPELVVSLTGAFAGNSDVSVGNVIGSNIFNILLILGVTSLLSPIAVTPQNRRRDIPITFAVSALFAVFVLYGVLPFWGGVLFLLLFAGYMYTCFKNDKGLSGNESSSVSDMGLAKGIALSVIGLAGLVFGGKFFVDSSVQLARLAGASDKFIAITLLAGGTSIPELATCILAAAKGKGQLALGNILGSNVFNILLILGCSSIVHPIDMGNIDLVDIAVMLLGVIVIYVGSITGEKGHLGRFDGIVMLIIEAAYFVWLLIKL